MLLTYMFISSSGTVPFLSELLGCILDKASGMYRFFSRHMVHSFKWKRIRRLLNCSILGVTSSSVHVVRRATRGLWSVSAMIDFPTK